MARPRKPDQGRINPRLSSKARGQLAALGRWLYPERNTTAGLVIEEALDDLYARLSLYRAAYASGLCPGCAQLLAPYDLVERPRGVYWCPRCARHLEGYYPDQPAAFYAPDYAPDPAPDPADGAEAEQEQEPA